MKICVDVRSPGQRGILSYTSSLLSTLLTVDRKNEYVIITDPKHGSWGYDGVDEVVVPSNNPLHWVAWSNTVLPELLKRRGVDVYHSFKHVTAYRLRAKKVLTSHGGGMPYLFPEFFKWYNLMYWKSSYAMAFRIYDRVIAVSHDEKRFFCEDLGYPDSKLRVTNLAASSRFRRINDIARLQQVKRAYNLPDHFILCVGAIHPQKNLEGAINAYYRAIDQLNPKPKLVIVGERPAYVKGPYQRMIMELIEQLGLGPNIILPGHIGHDLPCVYNLADLLLFPTRFEGFPLVPIEAMACGLPVVSSNIGAVQEVTGDAAILVNPDNPDEIAEAVVQVLSSEKVRHSLIQKGLERSEVFSWDRCARETIEVYEELVYA